MKKSVLSLLALAIATVSVFTSCDKSNDGYETPQTKTQVQSSATHENLQFVACLTSDQLNYTNTSYVIAIDGKEMTIDLSQMAKVSNPTDATFKNAIELDQAFNDGSKEVTEYSYDLSQFPGKSFTVKKINCTAKDVTPASTKMTFLSAAGFANGGYNNGIVDTQISKTDLSEDNQTLKGFCDGFSSTSSSNACIKF